MDCFQDPVYDRAWTAEVTTGARVRDVACMEGSAVLATVAVGTTVNVIGETDGWYKVETSDGTQGWVGQWLLSVTSMSGTADLTPSAPVPTGAAASSLLSRVAGYILLQVEQNGEAWYVNPTDSRRYYMPDGPTAYEMMRTFGLGITDADLAKVQAGDASLVSRLRGRILLQVEQHGEAYYVHPSDGTVHYMKDGDAAYALMRSFSLGITDSDLAAIPEAVFTAI